MGYRRLIVLWLVIIVMASSSCKTNSLLSDLSEVNPDRWATPDDLHTAKIMERREADWRVGPVVYHIFVDRFAKPDIERLNAKKEYYVSPRKLRAWEDPPERGEFNTELRVWSHELDFWGGDLQGVINQLNYIESLNADVVYLNPLYPSLTNHRYDAYDFFDVAPEYGSREDVMALASALHQHGMRIMLDGVFNHMGSHGPKVKEAMDNPDSPWRQWFYIGEEYGSLGYRAWVDVPNIVEVNLENPDVRAKIYGDKRSVVQGYIRDGIDGWRLDTAYELGFVVLGELTLAAHRANPDACVIAEAWNYPEEWVEHCDGIMNFFVRDVILGLVDNRISGRHAGQTIERMMQDAGTEQMLRSWIILDNHDTPRLIDRLPSTVDRRIAQILQFTLPGAPVLYYGTEVGMAGDGDPENRAPMRWDLVNEQNETLNWTRQLIALRKNHRALRIGEFRLLDTDKLLAFQRLTDRAEDTVIVLVNPTDEPVSEIIATRNPKLMSYHFVRDVLSDTKTRVFAGLLTVTIPPKTAWVLCPEITHGPSYSAYDRVR